MKEFQIFIVYKTCAEDKKAHARIATGESRLGSPRLGSPRKNKSRFLNNKGVSLIIVINTSCSAFVE